MKKLLISLVSILSLLSTAAEKENAFFVNFDDPAIRNAALRCPAASLEKDFEGTWVLTVEIPEGKTSPGTETLVSLPLDLQKSGLAGYEIQGEADLCFSKIPKPAEGYFGVKFMLPYRFAGERHYPEFLPENFQRWGSSEWVRVRGRALIPGSLKSARLNLGLQGASGRVSYRNIRFYRLSKAPVSLFDLPPSSIRKARYTIDIPRQRGAMSPGTERVFPKEAVFRDLAAYGANHIRYQMNIPGVRGRELTMEELKNALDRQYAAIGTILEYARKHGLKVALDLHSTYGFPNTKKLFMATEEGRGLLLDFWKKTVKRYKGHPAIWGYNLLNEPHSRVLSPSDPPLAEQYQRLISEIRKIDPVTPIIVESDAMSNPSMLPFLPVFDFDNIIYSIHFYYPGRFTHQRDPAKKTFVRYPDPDSGLTREALRRNLEPVRKFQLLTGARIYVGEFSAVRWAPGAERYLKDCIDLFEEYGWDWAYHAFREWDGWSFEHSDDPAVSTPVPMTGRKKVLLEGFRNNRQPVRRSDVAVP